MQEKKGQKAQKTSNKHGKEEESSCSGIHDRLAIAKETEKVNTYKINYLNDLLMTYIYVQFPLDVFFEGSRL